MPMELISTSSPTPLQHFHWRSRWKKALLDHAFKVTPWTLFCVFGLFLERVRRKNDEKMSNSLMPLRSHLNRLFWTCVKIWRGSLLLFSGLFFERFHQRIRWKRSYKMMPFRSHLSLVSLDLCGLRLECFRLVDACGGWLEGELVGAVRKSLVQVRCVVVVGVHGRGGGLAVPEFWASWVQAAKAPAAASAFSCHLKGRRRGII